MVSRLLVVAPTPLIEAAICAALPANVVLTTAHTPGEMVRGVVESRPGAVITYIAAPVDGGRECELLRALGSFTLIVVWERLDSGQLAACLDAGADAIVSLHSPYLAGQLTALLHQHRLAAAAGPAGLITVDDLIIDEAAHSVTRSGRHINLTPIEFRVLLVLARRAGMVVPVREILSAVWGPEYDDDIQYVRLYVGYLRAKLERDPVAPRLLHTQWGVGYRLGGDNLAVRLAAPA